ncbi:hypothetical protein, partial [Enterococcus hirae]|uniref:hypothetical protein n=1 Tax=Enterococcus hirae TaxID=1354 RepID=UPI00136CF0FE
MVQVTQVPVTHPVTGAPAVVVNVHVTGLVTPPPGASPDQVATAIAAARAQVEAPLAGTPAVDVGGVPYFVRASFTPVTDPAGIYTHDLTPTTTTSLSTTASDTSGAGVVVGSAPVGQVDALIGFVRGRLAPATTPALLVAAAGALPTAPVRALVDPATGAVVTGVLARSVTVTVNDPVTARLAGNPVGGAPARVGVDAVTITADLAPVDESVTASQVDALAEVVRGQVTTTWNATPVTFHGASPRLLQVETDITTPTTDTPTGTGVGLGRRVLVHATLDPAASRVDAEGTVHVAVDDSPALLRALLIDTPLTGHTPTPGPDTLDAGPDTLDAPVDLAAVFARLHPTTTTALPQPSQASEASEAASLTTALTADALEPAAFKRTPTGLSDDSGYATDDSAYD